MRDVYVIGAYTTAFKKHPGMSLQYAAKQEKREDNKDDREARLKAKEYFARDTGKDPAAFR